MYLYHANALAFGGTFVRPLQEVGGSNADCFPASAGGRASAQVGEFNFKDIVSFHSSMTDVAWNKETGEGKDIYRTRVSVVIERLNILNMLAADRVVAQWTCEHTPEETAGASIATTGSHFENLRIAGRPVELEYAHGQFHQRDALEKADSGAADGEAGAGLNQRPAAREPRNFPVVLPARPEPLQKAEACSFVKRVHGMEQAGGPEIRNCGSILAVPRFGTIYLGEVFISPGDRRVNMFRLELELESSGLRSIAGGSLVAGNVESHGSLSLLPASPAGVPLQERASGGGYAALKARYQLLVDQKYLSGLTPAESEELLRLESALDEMDQPYYNDALRRLSALEQKGDSRS